VRINNAHHSTTGESGLEDETRERSGLLVRLLIGAGLFGLAGDLLLADTNRDVYEKTMAKRNM